MNFYKIMFLILILLNIQFTCSEELIKVYYIDDTTGKVSTKDYYLRKIIEEKRGKYIVQDFYLSGNKKTLPYVLLNKDDLSKDVPESIDGDYVTCDLAGNKEGIIQFNKGIQNGRIGTWYNNGVTKKTEVYIYGGKLMGPFTAWHPNGVKQISGALLDNSKPIGIWTYWDDTGKITKEIYWKPAGKKVKEIDYDVSGKIIKEISFDDKGNEIKEAK